MNERSFILVIKKNYTKKSYLKSSKLGLNVEIKSIYSLKMLDGGLKIAQGRFEKMNLIFIPSTMQLLFFVSRRGTQ